MTTEGERLSVGELAALAGISAKTLRRYSDAGLVEPVAVDPATGYRWYDRSQADDARLAVLLRRLDMPVAAVADVLRLPESSERWHRVAAFWSEQRQVIAERERLLGRVRTHLLAGATGAAEATATAAGAAAATCESTALTAFPAHLHAALGAVMASVTLPPEVPVFSQGDEPDALFVVVRGAVRVVVAHPGLVEQIVVAVLGVGEVFGELGVLDDAPRAATVITNEDCDLLRLSRENFLDLAATHGELEETLRSIAARR